MRIQEKDYPERLRTIADPPKEIYVLGRLPEAELPTVAVIGARDCSEYGKYVASGLGAVLGRGGIQVVSGMARGIDGIGQEAALDAGGSSFAVLGCGVDVCYPAGNRRLYDKLKRSGGILSEYPPGTPPHAWHFPPRNRIVSGLADVVVVVEARMKSGTLITVDMALEQGREVYVVPGRVTDPLSAGCNRLLKLGAGILLDEEEFMEEVRQICKGRLGSGTVRSGTSKSGMSKSETVKDKTGKNETGKSGTQKSETVKIETANSKVSKNGTAGGGSGGREAGNRRLFEDPMLLAVYEALDFSPGSADEIRERLPERYRQEQINGHLIRLCLENMAVQVSPGQFCLRGNYR